MAARTPALLKLTACLGVAAALGASVLRAAPAQPGGPGARSVVRQDDQVVDRVSRWDMRAGSARVPVARHASPAPIGSAGTAR